MEGFFEFLAFVCFVLSVVLFLKIWRMANDIHALREKYAPKTKPADKYAGVPTTWEEYDEREDKRAREQRENHNDNSAEC